MPRCGQAKAFQVSCFASHQLASTLQKTQAACGDSHEPPRLFQGLAVSISNLCEHGIGMASASEWPVTSDGNIVPIWTPVLLHFGQCLWDIFRRAATLHSQPRQAAERGTGRSANAPINCWWYLAQKMVSLPLCLLVSCLDLVSLIRSHGGWHF